MVFVALSTRRALEIAAESFQTARKLPAGQITFENLEESSFWILDGTVSIFKSKYWILFLTTVLKNKHFIVSYLVSTSECADAYYFLWKATQDAVQEHAQVHIRNVFCLGDNDTAINSFCQKFEECHKLDYYTHIKK